MRFVEEQWNTLRAICCIACCMDSALEVNCLQVQQQRNSIDCGVFAIAFAVDVCFGLPPNESCYDVIEMRNHLSTCLQLQELWPLPKISRRVLRCKLFERYIVIFVYVDKTFLWAIRKIVLITLWLDVLFVMSGFTKNAWALAKKSVLHKMNIKNVTADCNVYNETLHLWNFFVFFSPHLLMSGFL